jgi:hypothetical protein
MFINENLQNAVKMPYLIRLLRYTDRFVRPGQLNILHDNLSCDKLNSYHCKLGSLKLLFVDEISLIQASLWSAMHSCLTQIMAINSNTVIFGNMGIIAIGDFYQCSPVASSSIYSSLL